jgi:hypothetical protein
MCHNRSSFEGTEPFSTVLSRFGVRVRRLVCPHHPSD